MGSEAEKTEKTNFLQVIPDVHLPSDDFLDQFTAEDRRVLEKFLREPIEYVDLPKFKAAATEQELFGRSEALPASARGKAAARRTESAWVEPDLGNHDPHAERFLFERYNYARFRIYRILKRHARKTLTLSVVLELLHWGRRALRARADIIQLNMPLVMSMAKRSRLDGLDYCEMISEGNMALIRSVEKFDPSRGFKFSTYGCRAILKSFSRVAMRASRYRGMFPVELTNDLEKSDFLQRRRQDAEVDLIDELKHVLASNVARLNDVESTVIRERFALGALGDAGPFKTLEQVGNIIGVTKERVRQIQNKALQKIKIALEQTMAAA